MDTVILFWQLQVGLSVAQDWAMYVVSLRYTHARVYEHTQPIFWLAYRYSVCHCQCRPSVARSCLSISASKFYWRRNRLLPDGAADSARCTWFCGHSTCRSTMPARELYIVSKNDLVETMSTYPSRYEPRTYLRSGERCMKTFGKLHPKPNTVAELKVLLSK